ncbi:ArsR/SmtB family transcription factor [Candidatus Nanohalobium constans]|uniref:ArsR family transcriptional regulator n=1 Tax=Candidatus Nanohalobium constans TaxID=2565781 RepID=A0A5Q0UH79_9ARCH|nr:winged helix-turn-helix domain-containing protein [Candidatus Nanohalobium constans]QGA81022.1 ArsR family transcriptional regulator [Candidatus Nanohalobium constans]
MELDFDTVKALSSQTRIQILHETVSKEPTPTDISKSIDRSKSTVSSHLSKLQEAGLVEKDEVDGRRRVIYRATDKTETILKGKNQKVKFSILSTVSSIWIGVGLTLSSLKNITETGSSAAKSQAGQMGAMALDKTESTASETGGAFLSNFQPVDSLLFVGVFFLSIALASLIYGLFMSQIGGREKVSQALKS